MSKRAVLALVAVVACSGSPELTSAPPQAVTGSNGVYQNGLTTNGVYQNGVYQNGVYQNGVYQNGVYQNGVYQNGVYQNGVYQNGVYQNGVYQNGVYQNGVYQNGVYQNGVYQNGVYQNGHWESGLWSTSTWQAGTNAEAMRTNRYTRQFFQYVYACGMPGSFDPSKGPASDPTAQIDPLTYTTSVDPNNGTLACNAQGGCDDPYYTCATATDTCVVPLEGSVGVGVNADGTTWWGSGKCDETCQRWVSACVLARTNAYGVHVDISMRAPKTAPKTIQNALEVTGSERDAYPLREGAYFGNVFGSTPVDALPAGSTYTGPITGLIKATPSFFACAGPGSNIPEVTKRFCSSQGDQAVISVPGLCLTTNDEAGICDGEDTNILSTTYGAMHGCHDDTSRSGSGHAEVITVFLKQPIAVCGNAVCESTENPATCPSDCHPGTWAKTISTGFNEGYIFDGGPYVSSAVGPDDSVVLGGSGTGLDFGGGTIPGSGLALVKYAADGTYLWGKTVGPSMTTKSVAVGGDGGIVVAGYSFNTWLGRFDANGNASPGWPITIGGAAMTGQNGLSVAIDHDDNVLVQGNFVGTATFPTQPATTFTSIDHTVGDIFVAKVSRSGVMLWVVTLGPSPWYFASPLTVDPAGNALLAVMVHNNMPDHLYKLSAATGAVIWDSAVIPNVEFCAAASDANGDLYVTTSGGVNLVAKVSGTDGSLIWAESQNFYHPSNVCYSGHNYLAVAADGTVVAGSPFGGSYSPFANFASFGVFDTYAYEDLLITGYASANAIPDGTSRLRWAKQLPMILLSRFDGMHVDSRGHLIVSGVYTGSMQVDDHLIVNKVPELFLNANTFLASFDLPSPADVTPPCIGNIATCGSPPVTVPGTILVQATGPAGANVFYMPPTAIDDGHAGTNVSCSPRPNTMFHVGTTTVTCTASDPVGNTSVATFQVIVNDGFAPILSDLPADITSNTAVVTYTLPTAFDQVDGPRPVTCTPASGSTFPYGTSTVTCSASDTSARSVTGTFTVTITTPPPVIVVPSLGAVEAVDASGSAVAYTVTATDAFGSSVAVVCSPASGSTFAIGTTTVNCSAHDAAGNTATASFVVGVVDTTAPALLVPSTITAEATAANGASVTYATSATDLVDGARPVSCSIPSGSVFAFGAHTVQCSTADARGNTRTASFTVTVVDTTPPALTVPANITTPATGASGAVVSYTATATDSVDGPIDPTCLPVSSSTFPVGTTTVTCAAVDAHGNAATASFTITVTDTTAPVITVPATVTANATSATGANVTFAASAIDAIDGSVPVTCSPASGSVFALGTTTVSCSSHDAAGNSATRTFQVTVQFPGAFFAQPINSDGSSIFKLGRTIPVKFQLTGASAGITTAVANLSLTRLTSSVLGTYVEATTNSAADTGSTFRYDASGGQYIFNLSTDGLTQGTYRLRIDLHDGVMHTVDVSLR